MYETVPAATAFPWSSVVQVVTYFADGYAAAGSGVVVGPNDVLTAAHVISDPNHGAPVAMQVAPGVVDGRAPLGVFDVAKVDFFPVDADGDRFVLPSESAYDLAVLGFTRPIAETSGAMALDPGFAGGPANVSGYAITGEPSNLDNAVGPVGMLAEGVLDISALDVVPGFSGGPVWHDLGTGPVVAGVVSTGIGAADLGNEYFDEVLGWIAANDDLLPIPVATAAVADAGTGPAAQVAATEAPAGQASLDQTPVAQAPAASSEPILADDPVPFSSPTLAGGTWATTLDFLA
jgi:V8-like Glu-specific endopeptidase